MSALVYGGRSPIALELCAQLAKAGHQVHLVTRALDDEILRLGGENGCTQVHACNLEDEQSSVALAKGIDAQEGGLDAVAFVHRYHGDGSPLTEYTVDVLTPFRIVEALSTRERQHECSIVLTTSPAAQGVLLDQGFQYHASKAAIGALIRYGAVRFADRRLRVNGISPGSFVFKQRAAEYYAANPQVPAIAASSVPLGRMASVSDIASVAVFLLGDQSRYVNGQTIEVDGGISVIDNATLARRSLVS